MTGKIIIKRGREKSIQRQHPWVFSGAIEKTDGNPTPGDIVTVESVDGRFLARGYWNPKSQIQVRILTWQDEEIDGDWWGRMLRQAIAARAHQNVVQDEYQDPPIAYRLINAENDFLPGLVVDRYDQFLVLQALTLGIDRQKEQIARFLPDVLPVKGVYERSDVDARNKEGLLPATGVLWGEEPPAQIEIVEAGGVRMLVDVRIGHKTGAYLDQAQNRRRLFELLSTTYSDSTPRRVLNLFGYTGGFGLHALDVSGTQVITVDSSQEALDLAARNVALNLRSETQPQGIIDPANGDRASFVAANVFDYLRQAVTDGQQYDVIVLDPPKFASNQHQVEKASRGYKDINLNAFRILKPGGYLMTFSCSGAISRDLFQKIVFGALEDSGRKAQIIQHLGAAEDHPVALSFPDGEYLKGLLLRVY